LAERDWTMGALRDGGTRSGGTPAGVVDQAHRLREEERTPPARRANAEQRRGHGHGRLAAGLTRGLTGPARRWLDCSHELP